MRTGPVHPPNIEIILAEDDAAEALSTVKTLNKAKISNRIHVVRTGKELLELLFRKNPSAELISPGAEALIILSLKLADSHGLDVLRKIKGDERTKALPVIILTSSQEERGAMQSYKLGANACIVKPLELSKLVEAVAELRLHWLLVPQDDPNRGKL